MTVNSDIGTLSVERAKDTSTDTDVRSFDFVRTAKITNEQQISFRMVTQRMAKSIERKLSSLARVPAQVEIDLSDVMPFSDFTDMLANPCSVFVFRADDAAAEGAADLSTDCAFYLIDRLFGGSGESAQQNRPLSELEQSVVRGVAERMLDAVKTAWSEYLELKPEIVSFASTPDDLRARNRGDVFVTRFKVTIESVESVVSVAVPLAALETFLQADNRRGTAPARDRSEPREYRSAIEGDLRRARMTVSARLAPLSLTARSIAELAVGQVLQTNQHVDMPIQIHVNDHPRFVGTLGQVRRHVGVQLTEAVHGGASEKSVRTTRGRIL